MDDPLITLGTLNQLHDKSVKYFKQKGAHFEVEFQHKKRKLIFETHAVLVA